MFVRVEVGVTHSRWAFKTGLLLDACDTSRFGNSTDPKPVAVYGDVIVVGAPNHEHIEVDPDGNSFTHDEAGQAYVFTRDDPGDVNSEWSQAATLTAEVFNGGDNFGVSVGVWNETVSYTHLTLPTKA